MKVSQAGRRGTHRPRQKRLCLRVMAPPQGQPSALQEPVHVFRGAAEEFIQPPFDFGRLGSIRLGPRQPQRISGSAGRYPCAS